MTTVAKSAGHDELVIPPPAPRTPSGIDVPLLATPDMVREPDPGQPAQFPFTRGIFPDGFRGRLWTIRQYSGFGTIFARSGTDGTFGRFGSAHAVRLRSQ